MSRHSVLSSLFASSLREANAAWEANGNADGKARTIGASRTWGAFWYVRRLAHPHEGQGRMMGQSEQRDAEQTERDDDAAAVAWRVRRWPEATTPADEPTRAGGVRYPRREPAHEFDFSGEA